MIFGMTAADPSVCSKTGGLASLSINLLLILKRVLGRLAMIELGRRRSVLYVLSDQLSKNRICVECRCLSLSSGRKEIVKYQS